MSSGAVNVQSCERHPPRDMTRNCIRKEIDSTENTVAGFVHQIFAGQDVETIGTLDPVFEEFALVKQVQGLRTADQTCHDVRTSGNRANRMRNQTQFCCSFSLPQPSAPEVHSNQLSLVPESEVEVVKDPFRLKFDRIVACADDFTSNVFNYLEEEMVKQDLQHKYTRCASRTTRSSASYQK